MQRSRRLTGVALSIALLVALVLPVSAESQEQQVTEVKLTPSRGSGVSGTATLEGIEGSVEVTLEMQNLPEAGVQHINHIHAGGTCADDRAGNTAPVTIPLNTVVAQEDGTGSATTTLEDVTMAQLFGEDKERFILFHAKAEEGGGVPPGIACAGLAPLPSTGGMELVAALLVGTILALGGAAVVSTLRCRAA
jgi:Cu/Zn superoxide dismutase